MKDQKERKKYIYCRECKHIDLIENFPFDFPDEKFKERYCPNCMNTNHLINLNDVKICSNCKELPAEDKNNWCYKCIGDFEEDSKLLEKEFNLLDWEESGNTRVF